MKEYIIKNKERRPFFGFESICIHLTAEAMQWLDGTTNTQDMEVSNRAIFHDLLRRMRLTDGQDDSYRRPQKLLAGQAQFSEIGLAEQWNMGRKKVHNLLAKMAQLNLVHIRNGRTASVMTFVCVVGWCCGGHVKNRFYLYSSIQ